MINVMLCGCNGGMGKVLQEVISNEDNMQVVVGYDSVGSTLSTFPIFDDINKCNEKIDVIIDFSHFSAFDSILNFSLKNEIPIVIATTGLSEKNEKALVDASTKIPIFRTANMSVGINVILNLVKKAANLLSDFDIEIVEKHHNKKVDSPSGTALMIADGINESLENKFKYQHGREGKSTKRKQNEIGIHAIRGGTIPGEHSVIFAGIDEIIEIKHTAMSKKVFAEGAVKAAKFILSKNNGYYDMYKLLEL